MSRKADSGKHESSGMFESTGPVWTSDPGDPLLYWSNISINGMDCLGRFPLNSLRRRETLGRPKSARPGKQKIATNALAESASYSKEAKDFP
jgi:hypothetical protein